MSRAPVILVREDATLDPTVAEVFERLAKGTVGVVNIHRTFANSPAVFKAFIGLAHALRFETTIPAKERELAILRVLALHHGHYEAPLHRTMALAAGATAAQADSVAADVVDASLFDARELATLRYAEAFASGQGVPEAVSTELARHLDNRVLVELSLTLSLYLGLAHVTNALDIPLEPARG